MYKTVMHRLGSLERQIPDKPEIDTNLLEFLEGIGISIRERIGNNPLDRTSQRAWSHSVLAFLGVDELREIADGIIKDRENENDNDKEI